MEHRPSWHGTEIKSVWNTDQNTDLSFKHYVHNNNYNETLPSTTSITARPMSEGMVSLAATWTAMAPPMLTE